jgi:hypothetical protein
MPGCGEDAVTGCGIYAGHGQVLRFECDRFFIPDAVAIEFDYGYAVRHWYLIGWLWFHGWASQPDHGSSYTE